MGDQRKQVINLDSFLPEGPPKRKRHSRFVRISISFPENFQNVRGKKVRSLLGYVRGAFRRSIYDLFSVATSLLRGECGWMVVRFLSRMRLKINQHDPLELNGSVSVMPASIPQAIKPGTQYTPKM